MGSIFGLRRAAIAPREIFRFSRIVKRRSGSRSFTWLGVSPLCPSLWRTSACARKKCDSASNTAKIVRIFARSMEPLFSGETLMSLRSFRSPRRVSNSVDDSLMKLGTSGGPTVSASISSKVLALQHNLQHQGELYLAYLGRVNLEETFVSIH